VLQAIEIDWDKLGRALLHPSHALSRTAAGIARASGRVQKDWVSSLIKRARGFNLAAIAYVAEGLPQKEFEELLLYRLESEGTDRTDYLLRCLSSEDLPWSERLERVLVAELHGLNAQVAEAAGKLLLGHAEAKVPVPAADLQSAFEHWQCHEKPYPKGRGAIPPSPRGDLLKALLLVTSIPHDRLMELSHDPRSDVSATAQTALQSRLESSAEVRAALVDACTAGTATPRLLARALRAKVPFTQVEIDRLEALTTCGDPAWRLASCDLLNPHYLQPERLRALARRLIDDADPEIQRSARRHLLDVERTWEVGEAPR